MSTAAQRKRRRDYMVRWNARQRLDAIAALGGACVHCGFDDIRALQIDHVHSDGSAERNANHRSGSYYRRVVREISQGRHQLLCANCNWIKRHTHNEVPRKDD